MVGAGKAGEILTGCSVVDLSVGRICTSQVQSAWLYFSRGFSVPPPGLPGYFDLRVISLLFPLSALFFSFWS